MKGITGRKVSKHIHFPCLYFLVFGLNTEIYKVNILYLTWKWENMDQKHSIFGHIPHKASKCQTDFECVSHTLNVWYVQDSNQVFPDIKAPLHRDFMWLIQHYILKWYLMQKRAWIQNSIKHYTNLISHNSKNNLIGYLVDIK